MAALRVRHSNLATLLKPLSKSSTDETNLPLVDSRRAVDVSRTEHEKISRAPDNVLMRYASINQFGRLSMKILSAEQTRRTTRTTAAVTRGGREQRAAVTAMILLLLLFHLFARGTAWFTCTVLFTVNWNSYLNSVELIARRGGNRSKQTALHGRWGPSSNVSLTQGT